MRKKMKQLIGILLTLVMVLGQMPGMSLTAYAAGEKAYAAYDVTTDTNKTKSGDNLTALQVTFNERQWYIIEDNSSSATSGTVTLLSADTTFGTKTFDNENYSNKYSTSQVKAYLDDMTKTGGAFADVAEAIETVNLTTNKYNSTEEYETVNGVKLYLLSTEEANSLPTNVLKAGFTGGDCSYNEWWLRSPGNGNYAALVYGDDGDVEDFGLSVRDAFGVRPALKLNLSSVIFSSNTFTVGSAKTNQTVTPPTAATGLTHEKDQAQALLTSGASVTTGNTAAGSIQYKVGTDGTWSSEIPTETNAGTYNVYYKVEGNDTYAEYAPAEPISVTIAKADPEPPEAFSAKYGQQAKDIPLPTGWSWAAPNTKFESSGGVELKANFEGDSNYNPKNNVSIYGTVAKAAAKISYATGEVTKELNSEKFTNEITNTGDVTPTYISSATSVATVDGTGLVTIQGIGETTITANVADDNDHYTYEIRKASYKLIVNPISTVINTAPTAAEITYGQKLSDSTLTGGVAKAADSEDTVAGRFAWKEPDLVPNASDSGKYDVVFTPTNTDYAESTCKVTIKVNKKTVSVKDLEDAQKPVAKTGDDVVYTGEPIELVTAPTADLPLDYEAYYSTDDGDSWTKVIPKKTDSGTYTVKVKYVSKGGNCNDITLDDITVTITPADKKALTDAIAAAKEYYDTIKGNTDYKEVADKLDKAIKAAEEVAAKNKVTKAEVSTATEALNTAKTTAEAEVKDIDDTKAAQAVSDKIAALPAKDAVTKDDKAAINAAKEAFDALTDDQKKKVSEADRQKLDDAVAALAAIDGEGNTPTPTPVPMASVYGNDTVSIKKLELNVKGTQTLSVGEEATIKAAVTGKGRDESLNSVNWVAPSDHVVVTEVQADGSLKVKAVGPGTAFVTAVCGGKAKTVKYTVKQPVNKAEASLNAITLSVKERYRICVNLDAPTTDKFFYATNDKKVCAVNGKGIIAAKGVGTTTVDILAGEKKKTAKKVASITVTVKDGAAAAVEVKDVSINYVGNKNLYTGEMAYISTLVNGGSNNGGQAVKYSFSAKGIVKIDAYGHLTAKKAGKVTVTASCGGKEASVELTVQQPLKTLKVNKTYVKVKQGKAKTVTLSVKTSPAQGKSDIKAVWSVANEENGVKKISDENGKAVFEVSTAAKDTVVTATVTDPVTGRTYMVNSLIDVN